MSNYMKNIKLNYLFLVKDINITQGIWMLYLASKGLSLVAIGSLEAVFHITSFLMETPTGVVADLFGRKISRLIGVIIAIISSFVMIAAQGYGGFAVAFALSALSYNFESGANEAFIYDSLLVEGQSHTFMAVTSKYEVLFHSVMLVGLLLGGILGNIEYHWVYYAAITFSAMGLFVGFFFKEPPISDKNDDQNPQGILPAMVKQYKDSFSVVKGSPRLTYLIVFTSTIMSATTLTFYYIQLSFTDIGYSPLQVGLSLVVTSLAAIGGAAYAKKAHARLGEQKLIVGVAFTISLSVALCAFTRFALIPLSIILFAEALLFVATRDYINKLIPSSKRATLLSFDSMVFSFSMIVLFPLFGWVADRASLPIAFLALGGVLILFSLAGALVHTKPLNE